MSTNVVFVAAAIFVLSQQSACDFSSPKSPPAKLTPKAAPHRFVLTRLPDEGVAFDTKTGQICKTWAWSPGGKAPDPGPTSGNFPQRMVGEFAPTCLYLCEKYPSGS